MLQKRAATRGAAVGACAQRKRCKASCKPEGCGGWQATGAKATRGGAQVGEAGMGTGGGRRRKATWLKCARWDGVFAQQVEGWWAARVCVCVVCVAQGWSRVQWPGPPWATSGVSNSRSTWSTASNQSSARMAARWAEAAQFPLRTSRSAAARGMPLDKSGRALLVNLGLGLVFIDCSQRWGAELGGTRNAALRRRALQPLPPLPLSPSAAAPASSPQGCSLRRTGKRQSEGSNGTALPSGNLCHV